MHDAIWAMMRRFLTGMMMRTNLGSGEECNNAPSAACKVRPSREPHFWKKQRARQEENSGLEQKVDSLFALLSLFFVHHHRLDHPQHFPLSSSFAVCSTPIFAYCYRSVAISAVVTLLQRPPRLILTPCALLSVTTLEHSFHTPLLPLIPRSAFAPS